MAVYIIAEAGVNHNGDIEIAKKLIDMAKECGADAVKFQTFKAEESTGQFAEKAEYQKRNTKTQDSQLDMIRKLELPFEAFKELSEYCRQRNIDFISTPDGVESLECLVNLDVPLIKIGSTEVTNLPFLETIAKTNRKLILSTGMSKLGEVEDAVDTILSAGNDQLQLMHCTTDYPTEYDEVNLKAMVTLRDAFKLEVGYSDHTLSCEAAIAATTLGAVCIEKHITLDKKMDGPDHAASMEPDEFRQYCKSIRNTEKLLGDGRKRPTIKENQMMGQVRRSILASRDLREGTILTSDCFVCKRPGTGIEPKMASVLIGRRLKRDVARDEIIHWEDV